MLLETLLIAGLLGIVLMLALAFILFKIQQRRIEHLQAQLHAWQRAQEMRQQQWQVQQEKRANDLEENVNTALDEFSTEWQEWQTHDTERIEQLSQQYETAAIHSHIEHELARIPRVEDIPLSSSREDQESSTLLDWQPPQLRGANLAHRDLSHRYLAQANLRNANLAHTNLFMADLSGACLAGATLDGADLSGANLTGADVHNATLVDANLLVADLNDADFRGTNLSNARNLTRAQLSSVHYDEATQFDLEIDITMPRMARLAINEEDTPHIPLPPTPATPYEIPASVLSLSSPVTDTPFPTGDDQESNQGEEYPLSTAEQPLLPLLSDSKEETLSSFSGSPATQVQTPALDANAQPSSAPVTEDDSQFDQQETDLPEDNTENSYTALSDTEAPKRKYNGRKRAKVN